MQSTPEEVIGLEYIEGETIAPTSPLATSEPQTEKSKSPTISTSLQEIPQPVPPPLQYPPPPPPAVLPPLPPTPPKDLQYLEMSVMPPLPSDEAPQNDLLQDKPPPPPPPPPAMQNAADDNEEQMNTSTSQVGSLYGKASRSPPYLKTFNHRYKFLSWI